MVFIRLKRAIEVLPVDLDGIDLGAGNEAVETVIVVLGEVFGLADVQRQVNGGGFVVIRGEIDVHIGEVIHGVLVRIDDQAIGE